MTYVIVAGWITLCIVAAVVIEANRLRIMKAPPPPKIERRATNRIARLQQIQKNSRIELTRHLELMDAYLEEAADLCGVADTSGWRKDICDEIVYCNRDPRQVMEDLENANGSW